MSVFYAKCAVEVSSVETMNHCCYTGSGTAAPLKRSIKETSQKTKSGDQ